MITLSQSQFLTFHVEVADYESYIPGKIFAKLGFALNSQSPCNTQTTSPRYLIEVNIVIRQSLNARMWMEMNSVNDLLKTRRYRNVDARVKVISG